VRYGGFHRSRRGPRRQGTRQRSAAGSGARGSLPPWATAVGRYRREGRRQPRLYKGRRWPPPPTPAASSSFAVDAPSSPRGMFSLSSLVN
jgi:hypothetical protein